MLRQLCLLSFGTVLVSCVSWEAPDIDGDGILASDGDCNDLDAEIGPNVAEIWYDGVDQNCDGNDADQDGDGFDSWQVGGPDCWDDPNTTLEGFDVLSTDWTQPTAADVHPDATEVYYDGVDQNCDGFSDFDQDGDGYDTSKHTQRDGSVGDDCIDGNSDNDSEEEKKGNDDDPGREMELNETLRIINEESYEPSDMLRNLDEDRQFAMHANLDSHLLK